MCFSYWSFGLCDTVIMFKPILIHTLQCEMNSHVLAENPWVRQSAPLIIAPFYHQARYGRIAAGTKIPYKSCNSNESLHFAIWQPFSFSFRSICASPILPLSLSVSVLKGLVKLDNLPCISTHQFESKMSYYLLCTLLLLTFMQELLTFFVNNFCET